jgi:hypothetical protein
MESYKEECQMKQKLHIINKKETSNIIQVKVDIMAVPSQDRKFSRLKNRAQVFDDRRYRKPKYKKSYMED